MLVWGRNLQEFLTVTVLSSDIEGGFLISVLYVLIDWLQFVLLDQSDTTFSASYILEVVVL